MGQKWFPICIFIFLCVLYILYSIHNENEFMSFYLYQNSPPMSYNNNNNNNSNNNNNNDDDDDDSCKQWMIRDKNNQRRRNLWFDGRIISNIYCDQKNYVDSAPKVAGVKSEALYRSCNFRKNSVCYDLNNKEWIINPQTGNIYNNLLLLDGDDNNNNNNNNNIIENSDDNHLFDNDNNDKPINTINLNFASKSIHSADPINWWKYKIKKLNENIENIYYDKNPTLYGKWTEHLENFGHVLFDSYLSALITINNWYKCGINRYSKFNILLTSSAQKSNFDNSIGISLFNNIYTINDITTHYNNNNISNYSYICFNNLIIGTSQQEMMFGGIHLRQEMLKYMRNKILLYYNLNPFWSPKTKNDINILVLIKNSSAWNHANQPLNLHTDAIEWINNTYIKTKKIKNLYIINPGYVSFKKQLEFIHKSSIILCQWGGISFSNFLSPLKSVEIIITMYDKRQGYNKINEKWKNDKIPDFDMTARDTITTQITLRYWDKTNNSRILYLKQNILQNLIDVALQIIYSNYDIPQ